MQSTAPRQGPADIPRPQLCRKPRTRCKPDAVLPARSERRQDRNQCGNVRVNSYTETQPRSHTMRAYEIVAGSTSFDGLQRATRPDPTPQPRADPGQDPGRVAQFSRSDDRARPLCWRSRVPPTPFPLSDGSGEVVAIGAGVTRFRVGDRVARHLLPGLDRRPPARTAPWSRWARRPPTACSAEFVVFDEQDAVAVPAHLSAEAGSHPALRRPSRPGTR